MPSWLYVCCCLAAQLAVAGMTVTQHLGTHLTPTPARWPDKFHATMFKNRSNVLLLIDLYYDWPGGRNMDIIHYQQGATKYDIEWNNRTSFIFDRTTAECRRLNFTVASIEGILRPDWLDGAAYLGTETIDNRTTYVFTKADFITYYQDADSGRPVRWIFHTDGSHSEIMSFEEGVEAPESEWQAPVSCFSGGAASQEASP